MKKDLLSCMDINHTDLEKIFDLSVKLKAGRGRPNQPKPLEGKAVGMIFSKSSTRTRVSFEVGICELGGHALYLDQGKTQMGRGETVPDTARVLERYLAGIVIRTYSQQEVEELAANARIPVINALTDDFHPCQALTDIFTMYEYAGHLNGLKMAYLGDGASNMANSLIVAAKLSGVHMSIAAPEEYRPRQELLDIAVGSGSASYTSSVKEAMSDADFVYTDVWVSMGFEEESRSRMKILEPYRLDMNALRMGKPGVKVLHCLPAHRGEEITDEVMDSEASIVFDQAENRLHVQKAILSLLMA
ncbi:MAG: Ornithine carbamoyltransferase [Lentisphaerae bacterium ADurb.Bin242]|nr:MAG: Ornithine carbamoyltransferase [Lentisphaerae bacterium ADurb.Bin242]